MNAVRSFPPLARPSARVLILGSMPGIASLDAGQYYAHPRNAFWPIMGALVGARPELPYGERIQKLQDAGIALWDVLACCERPGSLDANIVEQSAQPNDFATFFGTLPKLHAIYFNGTAAEQHFRRRVLALSDCPYPCTRLPSTSPAHAGLSYDDKLKAWATLLRVLKEQ